jgi:hypothetical protein
MRTWRIGDGECIQVGPEDLQPETVCDYLASRSDPPWPIRHAPTAAEVAARFSDEARHQLWTHRRYVAGVLETAPEALRRRPEICNAMERLLIDSTPAVHQAARWWLEREQARGAAAMARSARALGQLLTKWAQAARVTNRPSAV